MAEISRRTVASAAAWSVPAVALAVATPAASASDPVPPSDFLTASYSDVTWEGSVAMVTVTIMNMSSTLLNSAGLYCTATFTPIVPNIWMIGGDSSLWAAGGFDQTIGINHRVGDDSTGGFLPGGSAQFTIYKGGSCRFQTGQPQTFSSFRISCDEFGRTFPAQDNIVTVPIPDFLSA